MKLLPVGLLLVAIVSTACDVRVDENGIRSMRVAEGRAEDVWTRSYTLPANGTFEVAGENGAIDVRAGSGAQVEVRAERETRADTEEAARELLQNLQIREEVAPDSVKLATVGGREHLGAARARASRPGASRISGSRAQRADADVQDRERRRPPERRERTDHGEHHQRRHHR